MKTSILNGMLIGGLLCSPLAMAHGDGSDRFLRFFDTNKDGVVTQAEFEAAMQTRFQHMDADHDGTVSQQEFMSYLKQRRQEHKQDRLKAMDQNQDGKVSKAEYLAYQAQKAETRFARLDRNHDGVLGVDEIGNGHRRHNGHGLFHRLDTNGDGVVSAEENRTAAAAWFAKLDTNGDKRVSADEIKAFRGHKREHQRGQ